MSILKRSTLFSIILFLIPLFSASGEIELGFEYALTSHGAEIISWSGNDQELTLPLTLGGEPISTIRANAFEGNDHLAYIVIPSSVEIIGERAFADCENLNMVILFSGLKEIGAEAFSGCSQLASFTLPDSLETIGARAFAGCENLYYFLDLTGPALREIGTGAFDDTLWFQNRTENLITICSGNMLLKYQGNEETPSIPWTIMGIAEDAFAGNDNVRNLVIPNYITHLNRGAISGMENLKTVSGGVMLESADVEAFRDLPLLQEISLPIKDLNSYHFLNCPLSPYGSEMIYQYDLSVPDPADDSFLSFFDEDLNGVVIRYCKTDIPIENGVLTIPAEIHGAPVIAIGIGACQNRSDIRELILPEGLQEIRSWAFAYDIELKTVVFPKSLKRIEADAFNNCPIALQHPELSGAEVDERAFYYSND